MNKDPCYRRFDDTCLAHGDPHHKDQAYCLAEATRRLCEAYGTPAVMNAVLTWRKIEEATV